MAQYMPRTYIYSSNYLESGQEKMIGERMLNSNLGAQHDKINVGIERVL